VHTVRKYLPYRKYLTKLLEKLFELLANTSFRPAKHANSSQNMQIVQSVCHSSASTKLFWQTLCSTECLPPARPPRANYLANTMLDGVFAPRLTTASKLFGKHYTRRSVCPPPDHREQTIWQSLCSTECLPPPPDHRKQTTWQTLCSATLWQTTCAYHDIKRTTLGSFSVDVGCSRCNDNSSMLAKEH
jgi:hypothetical protein